MVTWSCRGRRLERTSAAKLAAVPAGARTSTSQPEIHEDRGGRIRTRKCHFDELFIRQDIADYLHESGSVVLEAGTGERALELCRADMAVDVLLTDIDLHGPTNGWDIAEAFRALHASIAVVYV